MNIITINGRLIGPGHPAYIIAEMSANHNQDFEQAVTIVKAAKAAGADAVKLHTRYLDAVIGRRARQDVARGTPLDWGHLV